MTLVAIWAQDRRGVIAVQGRAGLPWVCQEDLKHFKRETKGHVCIVGGTTFNDLPKLPDRRFVILSRLAQQAVGPNAENVLGICSTPAAAFALAQVHDQNPYCIGGKQTFQAMWPYVTHITRTLLDLEVPQPVIPSPSPELSAIRGGLVHMDDFDHDLWEEIDEEDLSVIARVTKWAKRDIIGAADDDEYQDQSQDSDDRQYDVGCMKVQDLVDEEHRPILEDIAAGRLADHDPADSIYLTGLKDRYHHLLVQHRYQMASDQGSDLEPQLRALEILIHCGD